MIVQPITSPRHPKTTVKETNGSLLSELIKILRRKKDFIVTDKKSKNSFMPGGHSISLNESIILGNFLKKDVVVVVSYIT